MSKLDLVLAGFNQRGFTALAPYALLRQLRSDRELMARLDLRIFDFPARPDRGTLQRMLRSVGTPDVLGLSTTLWTIGSVLELAVAVKQRSPSTTIVLGGPEASARAEELLLRNPYLDLIVRDEGELPFHSFLRWRCGLASPPPDEVPDLVLRRESTIRSNPGTGEYVRRFACSQVEVTPHRRLSPWQILETTRGCPRACAYCSWKNGQPPRKVPVPTVLRSLEVLFAHPEVKVIYFADPDILEDRARAGAIFELVARVLPERTTCYFEINPDHLDEDYLRLLATVRRGLHFDCSFPHADPAVEASCNRASVGERAVSMLRELRGRCPGCRVQIEMVYGLPGERGASFLETLERALAIEPDGLILNRLLVLPGSGLRRRAAALGLIHNPEPPYELLATPTMTAEEVLTLRRLIPALTWLQARVPLRPWFRHRAERRATLVAEEYLAAAERVERLFRFVPRRFTRL
ncbi:MAG: hypothetical protein A2284_06800 [Deltaproteobacteria bacterium RIFOXYA12_FULL_61_11]|nr:MAG: hypothetical protein A2284_06800 [Deltaproteobacteria bacterium RIFOXYA12_FULL_61_11]